MSKAKLNTLALAICREKERFVLVDHLSDENEIALLEAALEAGERDPLESIYEMRARQSQEDEEFGDYVEELISRGAVKPEVLEHGLQWFRSKIKIEQFNQSEREASLVIAEYALKHFEENPERKDFILAGPQAKVRIRIFVVPPRPKKDRTQVA